MYIYQLAHFYGEIKTNFNKGDDIFAGVSFERENSNYEEMNFFASEKEAADEMTKFESSVREAGLNSYFVEEYAVMRIEIDIENLNYDLAYNNAGLIIKDSEQLVQKAKSGELSIHGVYLYDYYGYLEPIYWTTMNFIVEIVNQETAKEIKLVRFYSLKEANEFINRDLNSETYQIYFETDADNLVGFLRYNFPLIAEITSIYELEEVAVKKQHDFYINEKQKRNNKALEEMSEDDKKKFEVLAISCAIQREEEDDRRNRLEEDFCQRKNAKSMWYAVRSCIDLIAHTESDAGSVAFGNSNFAVRISTGGGDGISRVGYITDIEVTQFMRFETVISVKDGGFYFYDCVHFCDDEELIKIPNGEYFVYSYDGIIGLEKVK